MDHLEIAGEGQDGVLDRAWRLVLEDPDYAHRRRYYEHLVSSEQRKAEENERVKKEEGL
jgi:hypothetical protein